jgi:oligopeptide transport system substrate-binding protein
LYAHETAIGHYQRALTYLEQQGDYERAARTLMQLGLTYHNAFDFQQARQAYEKGFALWQRVGQLQPISSLPPAPHALRLIECDPPTLDPSMGGDAASVSVIIQLFSGLVETSPEMDVLPDVAQSWEVLEGGRRYIFHLRADVRWSDGEPVLAGDFEYAWRRVLAPATGSSVAGLFYDIEGAEAFHQGKVSDPDCVGVRALDEHTLVVELAEPTGYFLHLMTCSAFCPVPRHVVEAHGETWTAAERIVTNGPFRLEAWEPGKSIVLVRNLEYHGRFTGNVQRVVLDLSTDQSARLEMYEADALDVLTDSLDTLGLQPAVVDGIRQRYAEECLSEPVLNTRYIGFDTSRPPFDDARVRRAFALAIDREMLADVVLRGYVSPATGGLVPPGMPGHLAGGGLPYDPGQARQLLSEAGYPDGRGFPATDGLIPLGSVPAVIGEYLQTRWRENLGVEIEWEPVDWMSFLDRLYGEPPHLHLNIWLADYADPDSFLRGCLQQTAASIGWRDQAFADLVDKARRVTDQGERMKLYQQADKILIYEAVIVPLDHSRSHLLVKPWVRKFPSSVLGRRFWKDVVLEPH